LFLSLNVANSLYNSARIGYNLFNVKLKLVFLIFKISFHTFFMRKISYCIFTKKHYCVLKEK